MLTIHFLKYVYRLSTVNTYLPEVIQNEKDFPHTLIFYMYNKLAATKKAVTYIIESFCSLPSDPSDFTKSTLSEEVLLSPVSYQDDHCVNVTILDDSVYEEFEYLEVSLSTEDSCVEFKEQSIQLGIIDDDCEFADHYLAFQAKL